MLHQIRKLMANSFIKQKNASSISLTSLSYELLSVLDNQEALKALSRPLHLKREESSRAYIEIKNFSRAPPQIQGLFQTM